MIKYYIEIIIAEENVDKILFQRIFLWAFKTKFSKP